MIKKNDILVYAEVKVKQLNSGLIYPPVNFLEAKYYKVVGLLKNSDITKIFEKRFRQQKI